MIRVFSYGRFVRIATLSLVLLFQLGCASVKIEPPAEAAMASHEKYIQNLGIAYSSDIDRRMVESGLGMFLYFLEKAYGEEQLARFLDRWRDSGSFSVSIMSVYGRTVYQIGYEMNMRLNRSLTNKDAKLLYKDVGYFRVYFTAGSKAEQEMPFIEHSINSYFEKLSASYLSNAEAVKSFNSTIQNMENGKIGVYLFENYDQAKVRFPQLNSTAVSVIGFAGADGVYTPQVSVVFKYFSAASTTVFVHELTHVVFMLSRPGVSLGKVNMSDRNAVGKVKEQIKTVISVSGGALGEGLAEYMSEQYSILYKYGFFGDVNEEISWQICHGAKKISLNNLLKEKKGKVFHRKILYYQEAHSFTKYLVAEYGMDRFVELLLSRQTDGDFRKILGVSIKELERDWAKGIDCPGKKAGVITNSKGKGYGNGKRDG